MDLWMDFRYGVYGWGLGDIDMDLWIGVRGYRHAVYGWSLDK